MHMAGSAAEGSTATARFLPKALLKSSLCLPHLGTLQLTLQTGMSHFETGAAIKLHALLPTASAAA